ncbi:unnamed protein product [Kuraishia capsulata CBS 1993]|uniref:Succinate dehydrogenase assembly factor 3 n=1 Tax=Kuraishia capsulata CBS 1993 TaxID=1382522 RepID=W6MJ02_9ASCO|nr:uncharacterized protein KUCA_T00002456001 [Kuraishia capsulata CBS 1993]CDK26484.1 unnamed protein product [Kuraishia capsulata CBS 1993]
MRPSFTTLVRARRPVRETPPLMPPLQLYREILRAHRNLPSPQRALGDSYVRGEFRAHRKIDNPLHIVGFLQQWQEYLNVIAGGKWHEYRLSSAELDKMSPEQVGQLYELMKETQRIGRGEE